MIIADPLQQVAKLDPTSTKIFEKFKLFAERL